MNDIPGLNLLPPKLQHWAILLAALSPYFTRAYHALANGGGLRGVISAIWLGTNTPKTAMTASETAFLRNTVIKDVPAGQPVPTPSAPPAVQKANTP